MFLLLLLLHDDDDDDNDSHLFFAFFSFSISFFATESGKLVLITGVSKGLGRALAIEFAKRGYTVAGCSRNAERLLEVEKLLIEHGDGSPSKQHLLKQVDVV